MRVHLVNTQQYAALTGSPPPPSPISAATYAEYGLPWFSLYDEQRGDVAPSVRLGHNKAWPSVTPGAGRRPMKPTVPSTSTRTT